MNISVYFFICGNSKRLSTILQTSFNKYFQQQKETNETFVSIYFIQRKKHRKKNGGWMQSVVLFYLSKLQIQEATTFYLKLLNF